MSETQTVRQLRTTIELVRAFRAASSHLDWKERQVASVSSTRRNDTYEKRVAVAENEVEKAAEEFKKCLVALVSSTEASVRSPDTIT